nr:hypothetical protein Iba_scaffold42732CG0020 [Ipomoea batatas]GMD67116.1 hypothetical protein Iba_chr12cCG21530 [Ipomoea batatas]
MGTIPVEHPDLVQCLKTCCPGPLQPMDSAGEGQCGHLRRVNSTLYRAEPRPRKWPSDAVLLLMALSASVLFLGHNEKHQAAPDLLVYLFWTT